MSDESPEYIVTEITVSQTILSDGHCTLPSTQLLIQLEAKTWILYRVAVRFLNSLQ